MFHSVLRRLGREVYGAFLPLDSEEKLTGATQYLSDAWKDSPPSVALAHTVLCLAVYFMPLVVFPFFRPLSFLSASEKNRFTTEILQSKMFIVRLIGFGVKGHALVAILREPAARAEFQRESPSLQRSVV